MDEVRKILGGMQAQDTEEIIRVHDSPLSLLIIILEEGIKGLITNALAQIFKKVRAAKIYCVTIWVRALAVIHRNIHKTLRVEKIHAVRPPLLDQIGIHGFKIDVL